MASQLCPLRRVPGGNGLSVEPRFTHVRLYVLQQGRMPGTGVWASAYGLPERHSALGVCNPPPASYMRGRRRH